MPRRRPAWIDSKRRRLWRWCVCERANVLGFLGYVRVSSQDMLENLRNRIYCDVCDCSCIQALCMGRRTATPVARPTLLAAVTQRPANSHPGLPAPRSTTCVARVLRECLPLPLFTLPRCTRESVRQQGYVCVRFRACVRSFVSCACVRPFACVCVPACMCVCACVCVCVCVCVDHE